MLYRTRSHYWGDLCRAAVTKLFFFFSCIKQQKRGRGVERRRIFFPKCGKVVEKGEKKIFTRYLGFSHFSLFVQSGEGSLAWLPSKIMHSHHHHHHPAMGVGVGGDRPPPQSPPLSQPTQPPVSSSSSSSSLSDLYSVARRISFELQEGLIRLERLEGKGHGGNATLQEAREQRNKLQEMTRISQQMESQFRVLIVKENPSKRDTWKRKVSQISEECDQFRVALDRFGSRESRRMQEEQEREELMRRISGGGNMNNGGGDVTLNMGSSYDAEASAGMSMRRSGQMVDDLLDSGANILGSLHEQKDRLKSARRKVLSVLDTLGVSQSVLKVIDRRQRMDAIIVYGGMFFITFFIFVFWWFTRR
jgi:golgi SNAP receptor complex member 2